MNRRVCGIICSLVLWTCWCWYTSSREKIQSLVYATLFSGIEACWYRVRKGCFWTSWQQHYTLLLFSPLLFTTQETRGARGAESQLWLLDASANIFLFPLKVWLFEIIAGYYLQLLYTGKNPAWTYDGPTACCHGNIDVSFRFWLRWLCLGLLYELIVGLFASF